jgi:predicted ATPase/DNA-binding XRE family transcriptional regulator
MEQEAPGFGRLVQRYRLAVGWTQEELAERAGLSARAISDLERGVKSQPRLDTVRRLAQALQLDEETAPHFRRAAWRGGGAGNESWWAPERGKPRVSLPIQPTPFVGRQQELEEVRAVLSRPAVRLLTLTGPGGVGKTRLAVQVAEDVAGQFPDGVSFVSLGSLVDPGHVPASIASTLGLREVRGLSLLDDLTTYLRSKKLLLVLDNFEHLLPATNAVSHLLAACAHLTILLTSRTVLHLAAEREYPVPPLTLPLPGHLPALAVLARHDAIRLFVQRAEAVKPAFRLTEDNAVAVAGICYRLDGLPLAIELAASRVKLFPPRALLERLSGNLKLLTGGARDLPARQQTLWNTIDWSYSLLSAEEQYLFARLSAFAGGCSYEAVEAVCNPEGELDLVAGLASLLDHSLLRQDGEEEPRLGMLETLREYAREQLAAQGERDVFQRRHAAYYLALAERAEPELTGADQLRWLDLLEREHDNLRAALVLQRRF